MEVSASCQFFTSSWSFGQHLFFRQLTQYSHPGGVKVAIESEHTFEGKNSTGKRIISFYGPSAGSISVGHVLQFSIVESSIQMQQQVQEEPEA